MLAVVQFEFKEAEKPFADFESGMLLMGLDSCQRVCF
jgi:hypothetical protein